MDGGSRWKRLLAPRLGTVRTEKRSLSGGVISGYEAMVPDHAILGLFMELLRS